MVRILRKEEDRTKKRCMKDTDSDEDWTLTHAGVQAGEIIPWKLFFLNHHWMSIN